MTSDPIATARRRTIDAARARQARRAAPVPRLGARVFDALRMALAELAGPAVAKLGWLAQ